jgi:tryptophan 2,3-dioxygenase
MHELDKIKGDFTANDLYAAIHSFKRVRTVMKTLVGQLDILETMTPMSFSSFRDRLETASGFQSAQFRELEFLLGQKRSDLDFARLYGPESRGYAALLRRLAERTVIDHFYEFLRHRGVAIPGTLLVRDLRQSNTPNVEVQREILELYRSRQDVAILFESMTDFDEGLQEWRYRHVKLVERTIGNKKGTGGSLGVEFLKRSLFQPVFPDLWAIRHEL